MTTKLRNDRTSDALDWLGHVLTEYVTGDWSSRDIAEELAVKMQVSVQMRDGEGPTEEQRTTLAGLKHLRDALDAEITQQVWRARGGRADLDEACMTWDQIGEALGMSRQAAHKRYSDETD